MRLSALLASVHLVAGAMARATGDPSAMEIGSASDVEMGNTSALGPPGRWPDGPWCKHITGTIQHGWVVRLPGFESPKELRDMCGGLWGGLRRYIACVVSSPHGCDMDGHNATIMHWHFHTSIWCKPYKVEQSIASATMRKYGDVKCLDHE